MNPEAQRIAALIDHTILRADATRDDVRRVCAEAREYGFASVCVNGCWVPFVASEFAERGESLYRRWFPSRGHVDGGETV